jgi:archaellum biogenesis ATPase FlaH
VADVELNRQEKINIFKSLFKGRSDCYGAETSCIKESLTDSVITEHLLGQKRIGVYMMLTDSTYFACIDIDRKDNEPLAIEDSKEILNVSQSYGLHGCIERSKRKGFHIWYFFSDLVQASKIRALLKQIQSDSRIEKIEINPKQDHVNIDDDEYGNFVNLPLFKTDLATGRTAFLDLNFQPYSDQWQFLSDIKTITPKEIDDIIELNTISIIPEPEQKNTPKTTGIKGDLGKVVNGCVFIKHCIDEAGSLPEPLWYAMICNLVSLPGGHEKIHEFSEPYKSYTYNETQAKIEHAINDSPGPTTCKQIKELGFTCDNKTCNVKAPAGKAYKQTIDKSSKAGDPVTEKEAETKGKNPKVSEFDKHKEQVNSILSRHDLNTDEGKQSALIEAKAYINPITNPSIAGRLMNIVNSGIITSRRVETLGQFIHREKQKTPYIVSGGILPSQGYLLVAGETGVGKSTLAWQLCNCMLSGKPFFDLNILADDTHIMYLNLENSDYSVDKLLKAQLTEYNLTQSQLDRLILPDTTDFLLDSKPDVDFIKKAIKRYHIEVVVIDPISFSTEGDPCDFKTVTKYVKRLKKIRNADNEEISWILLHHYNKPSVQKNNPLHRIMGSSGWGNSATSIMTLERYAESRNPYYKRLDFVKLRDEKLPEYKLIAINDRSRCFERVEESTITKILPDKVVDALRENGKSMIYTELMTQVEFKNGISDRQARRLIKQALEQKLIKVNNGLYSLICP